MSGSFTGEGAKGVFMKISPSGTMGKRSLILGLTFVFLMTATATAAVILPAMADEGGGQVI